MVAECLFEFLLHQLIACTEESTRKSGVVDEDEIREVVAQKIESMGFDVGFRFMERCAQGKLIGLAVRGPLPLARMPQQYAHTARARPQLIPRRMASSWSSFCARIFGRRFSISRSTSCRRTTGAYSC